MRLSFLILPALLLCFFAARSALAEEPPPEANPCAEPAVANPCAIAIDPATVDPATLVISSQPSGGQVSIDGRDMGSTPITSSLSPGKHVVFFEMKPYANALITVQAEAGGNIDLYHSFSYPSGELIIESRGVQADILIEGVKMGVGKFSIDAIEPGDYELEMRASGFVTEVRTITVEQAKTTQVRVRLKEVKEEKPKKPKKK